MKRKLLIFLFAVVAVIGCVSGLSACKRGRGNDGSNDNAWGSVYTAEAAYAKAAELGYAGTLEEFVALISGKDGADGTGITSAKINSDGELVITLTDKTQINLGKVTGTDGEKGEDGLSAFEIYVKYHPDYEGTEQEWIESLKGADGGSGENAPVIDEAYIDGEGNLILVLTNGEEINCGKITDDRPAENLQYSAVKEDGQITGYKVIDLGTVSDMDIVIPSVYNGKPVVDVNFYGSSKKDLITSVVIPSSITSIGANAFYGCSGLESVIISYGVSSIGYNAFSACVKLKSVTIPASVTSIGINAFDGCTVLEGVIIPAGVEEINDYVFNNCKGLKNVTISDGVQSVGFSAFAGCESLAGITFPDSVETIGNSAFRGCAALESVTLSKGVVSVASSAFDGCTNIRNIVVDKENPVYHSDGNCLIETERKALVLGCNESVIPADGSVTSIGAFAFQGLDGLTAIVIPDSVTAIGGYAFQECSSLQSVTIGKGVTAIGDNAFKDCGSLTQINYNGSEAQWEAVAKADGWDKNAGEYTVIFNQDNGGAD